jgi:hypothetical protein
MATLRVTAEAAAEVIGLRQDHLAGLEVIIVSLDEGSLHGIDR